MSRCSGVRAHAEWPPSLSQADLLPYEVLQERYRTLLIQAEEFQDRPSDLERRQIGEQFRLVNAPQAA